MTINILNWLPNLSKAKILTLTALSFFVYMAVNVVVYNLSFVITFQPIPNDWLFVYGYSTTCIKNGILYSNAAIALLSVFFIVKALLVVIISKIQNQLFRAFIVTFTVTDLIFVLLKIIPIPINWDYYFQSSFLINEGKRIGLPDWVVFFFVGVIFTLIIKKRIKLSWQQLGGYFLIATASFGFQLCVYWAVIRPIML